MKKDVGDIDIDLADRKKVLELIEHIPAAIINNESHRRHNSGVYVTQIPYDPINDTASIDYIESENRGYFKLDLLNVYVYSYVKDNDHLEQLLKQEVKWELLKDRNFVKKLVHLSNHYRSIEELPEPIDSIEKLAMFISMIRPGKTHLIGKSWEEVTKTIWTKPSDGSYFFKKSHAISYSWLVAVHINLLVNGIDTREIV